MLHQILIDFVPDPVKKSNPRKKSVSVKQRKKAKTGSCKPRRREVKQDVKISRDKVLANRPVKDIVTRTSTFTVVVHRAGSSFEGLYLEANTNSNYPY